MNFRIMQLLDKANTDRFGLPSPVTVEDRNGQRTGILVTGHDLLDLEELLKQTQGTGVNVYTHGEMLPAHGYPVLRKYKNLVGNYGAAWQRQKTGIRRFGGPILTTTNCVLHPSRIIPGPALHNRYHRGSGVKHIEDRKDFSQMIEHARGSGTSGTSGKNITTGFHHTHT